MVESAAEAIARAVRARRLELHLTTDEAAARARIQEKSWRVIEQGVTNPSRLVISAVCRALDWTPARIESLMERELAANGNGGPVVDLDALSRADEAAAKPQPSRPLITKLDSTGLTAAQLADVQDYIDELRGDSTD
jgi:DNA-binding XRE family transcriptional regulator